MKTTALEARTTVAICETQPVTAEGLRSILTGTEDLQCVWCAPTLQVALQLHFQKSASIILLDRAFGQQAIASALSELITEPRGEDNPRLVVWGQTMTESDALVLIKMGIKGVLRKSIDVNSLLTCFRTVASGSTWLEDGVFRQFPAMNTRSDLTPREQQVLRLVELGLKNKDIAAELGIRPGTVKIHLKHIFEKTGVHGRYGLALSGLRDAAAIELPRTRLLSRPA